MKELTELLESQLGDYGYTWKIEEVDKGVDYAEYEVTFTLNDVQEGGVLSFRVYTDRVEVMAYHDGWETVEWWSSAVKWFWIAFLPTQSDYDSLVNSLKKVRESYRGLYKEYKSNKL